MPWETGTQTDHQRPRLGIYKSCNYCSWFLTTTTLRGVSDVTSCSNESQNAVRACRLGAVQSPTQYAVR